MNSAKYPLRVPAVSLGLTYLVSIVLLGELLGSTADASATYGNHFSDDAALTQDFIGAIALVASSAILDWLIIAMRATVYGPSEKFLRDLASAFGMVASAALIMAAGLLLTVPFTIILGRITGDPGIESSVQAGIAQAGSVCLFLAVFPLAIAVVLIGKLGKRIGVLPRWILVASWFTSVFLVLLGWTVGLLLTFALWSLALGLTWRLPRTFAGE